MLFFRHLDDDKDSASEEMQVSSTDLLLETSNIASLIITLTFNAVLIIFTLNLHHSRSIISINKTNYSQQDTYDSPKAKVNMKKVCHK